MQVATRNDNSNQGNISYTSSGRKRAIPSVVTGHKDKTDNQLSELNDNDTNVDKNDHQLIANESNTNGSCLNSNYNENTHERSNLTTGRLTRNRLNKADHGLPKKKRGQVHHTANDVIANKKRRLKKKALSQPLDSSQMTMSDLIYYNPSTNPMKHKSDDSIADPVFNDDNDTDAIENNDSVDSQSQGKTDRLPDRENRAPQVSIGPDGKIILNEDSLVIEASSERYELADVIDESDSLTTYRSYKKKSVTDRWSAGG